MLYSLIKIHSAASLESQTMMMMLFACESVIEVWMKIFLAPEVYFGMERIVGENRKSHKMVYGRRDKLMRD